MPMRLEPQRAVVYQKGEVMGMFVVWSSTLAPIDTVTVMESADGMFRAASTCEWTPLSIYLGSNPADFDVVHDEMPS